MDKSSLAGHALRPAIARNRPKFLPGGKVQVELKRIRSNDTSEPKNYAALMSTVNRSPTCNS